MPGEREARGKGIHSTKKTLDPHEMDSRPFAATAGRELYFEFVFAKVVQVSP
jgi:hypothetical protein